jgi:hypothetical protein
MNRPTGFQGATPSFEDIFRLYGHGMQNIAGDVQDIQNPFLGTTSPADVEKTYGMRRDVSGVFDPLRASLKRSFASNRSRALSSAATRMGGSTAMPEATFLPIEGQFGAAEGQALGELASQEGGAQLQQENRMADFLRNILGQGSQMEFQRAGTGANVLQNMLGGSQQYSLTQDQLAGPDFLDYLMEFLGAASRPAAAALAPAPIMPV